jgi:hypothetical protein
VSRTTTDASLAFCIGAVVGIGVALLLEANDDDDEASSVVRQLRRKGIKARTASAVDQRALRAAIAWARRASRRD